jgi:D-3-phosphoglycerate dehydrogenase
LFDGETTVRRIVYFDRLMHAAGRAQLEQAPGIALTMLERARPAEALWPVLAEAHGYQISSARQELPLHLHGTGDLLARCPNLLVVSADGAGVDTVDIEACTRAGVLVVNQSGGNKEGVAEHATALMLSLAKRIGETDKAMRRDRDWHRNEFIGNDVLGKTVGIIGLGHIGTRLAEICSSAFSMTVVATDPYLDAAEMARRGARKVALETLLAESDFVQICCPFTAETRHMIDAAALAAMREGAYLVSTARGGIHDEEALVAALSSGHIRGAGLDVWEDEPPPLDHPLLAFDTVIASPHTAGVTEESRRTISLICADQWAAIWRGERPPRLLNPDAWPLYAKRYQAAFGAPVGGN